ncbi:GAF domain-containing protein [Aliidiomarina soli]|uniref:GAF domain-containing protein n=1 Tax=Aliidiomarina soli TaxID=1928574 RepID=A0A432WML8_9GAMM|nr:GAF domain-containing protein [Aliidiomarina soli]RUO34937.1 GAF domain-containing protein [Aliidiomarina soli]
MNSYSTPDYPLLVEQAKAIVSDEPHLIANLANLSALLNDNLEDINWVGFYLADSADELVLGPFQGKVACVRIAIGKGVCGTAAAQKTTQRIADVHAFAGHIACDAASNSEIVLPIEVAGQVVAVLDIDSPSLDRFSAADQQGLEALLPVIQGLNWAAYVR